MTTGTEDVRNAYAFCLKQATTHYENFPVVSKCVPAQLRGPVAAIYSFARTSDDFADEGQMSGYQRRELLADWRRQLYQCVDTGKAENETFIALADTIKNYDVPVQLLNDLIKAFEMDTHLVRFPTFEDVLFYCKHSANPVGRIVLWLHDYRDENLFELSDYICTALQLANFWQDSRKDLKRNRLYYPLEDLKEFGTTEDAFFGYHWNPDVRAVVEKQVLRTQGLFSKGRPLCGQVDGMLSFHLKLTWLGGFEITRKLERQNFNPFEKRPKVRSTDKVKLVWNAMRWS